MFKFLISLSLLIILINYNEAKTYKRGRLNDNSLEDETPWPNMWFPHPPNYKNDNINNNVKTQNVNVAANPDSPAESVLSNEEFSVEKKKDSSIKWFPHPPIKTSVNNNNVKIQNVNVSEEPDSTVESLVSNEEFSMEKKTKGSPIKWFPHPPNYKYVAVKGDDIKGGLRGFNDKKRECDNGKNDLAIDFDPEDKRHSYNYLCLDKRAEYLPDLNTTAILKEYFIPPAYEPSVKCLNETIEYSEVLPTFGSYRPVAPKFGTYQYLPPQRWLHSLADGAIVLLYHPCAFAGQIEQLQKTLKGCLYRHIITPTQHLSPRRPLALLAWGKSLQMSVVDDAIVVKFIKDNAKLGLRQKQQKLKLSSKLYDAAILSEAHLVTDEQDKEICGYKEM